MSGGVVLVGPMGSGKTEVGRALAARLGRPFADTDELVVARAGRSVAEIFRDEGEAGFRAREAEAVREAAGMDGAVIACGGGAVLDPSNVEILRAAGRVVYLRVDAATAAERVGDGRGRPLLAGRDVRERLAELIAARGPLYEAACHVEVDANRPLEQVVDAIAGALAG